MSVNLLSVLDNIAAPIVVATPVKDTSGKITDFDIIENENKDGNGVSVSYFFTI